jgi:hypothetical protein
MGSFCWHHHWGGGRVRADDPHCTQVCEVTPASQRGDPSLSANVFYSGALRRIALLISIFSGVGILVAAILGGFVLAKGFATGALVSAVNLYLLKRSASALGDRIVNQQSSEKGGIIVAGFVFRYVLIGITGYVIFKGSVQGLYGFMAGLFLPIAAAGCEAAYELYVALRRRL